MSLTSILMCGFNTDDVDMEDEQDMVLVLPKRCALSNATSAFQRGFGQSSFRTTNSPQAKTVTVRRTASMTASDNNVYVKSMDGCIDELRQTQHSQQQIANGHGNAKNQQNSGSKSKLPQFKMDTTTLSKEKQAAGVVSWGTSFERLLEDPAGLQTFAEFLKKEFSAENIYFWTACERFRNCENAEERMAEAHAIYAKHLANGCAEPVNVDSQARNLSEERLQSAELDIFAPAQKQIFNLMKFDSYQRFIRSDLYKRCLEAEQRKQPLPFGADSLEDELLQMSKAQAAALAAAQGNSSKLKKSASNAEDRRRKSLLPWHRKTRSKSRDRNESTNLSSSNSLKIPTNTQNSMSDLHSSRSSLSSFDTLPGFAVTAASAAAAAANQATEAACSLCRVILSDGATTIVQTRTNETVQQLVERLLEKRGLTYQYFDVVDIANNKNIQQQSDAKQALANKEVRIEQRMAFKMELPEKKVISVRSKPKKLLYEVIKPILHKYNYSLDAVQVLVNDTQTPVDMTQLVSAVNGQRLQVFLLQKLPPFQMPDYQNGCTNKFLKPVPPKLHVAVKATTSSASNLKTTAAVPAQIQSTLDEITNKVFDEVLKNKVEAQAQADKQLLLSNRSSLKSDDCASETSSLFERMRKRDSNIPGFRVRSKKKSNSSQHSDETATVAMCNNTMVESKKPIIAKLKAGVKLQVTERVSENADELLEGLKRAQLARLEDQRGTEINFELPEFLKNKENLSAAASKLRKVRANLSPVQLKSTPTINEEPTTLSPTAATERPQPAPRLSITNRNRNLSNSSNSSTPMKIDEEPIFSAEPQVDLAGNKAPPPPLPPKPKVLPIKPSNWGVVSTLAATFDVNKNATSAPTTPTAILQPSKIPIDITRKNSQDSTVSLTARCAYLEEPSSSFV